MTVEHNNVTNRPLPVVAILACNRLNPTRALLKIRSMIKKTEDTTFRSREITKSDWVQ